MQYNILLVIFEIAKPHHTFCNAGRGRKHYSKFCPSRADHDQFDEAFFHSDEYVLQYLNFHHKTT